MSKCVEKWGLLRSECCRNGPKRTLPKSRVTAERFNNNELEYKSRSESGKLTEMCTIAMLAHAQDAIRYGRFRTSSLRWGNNI